jgi:hypothetical protein
MFATTMDVAVVSDTVGIARRLGMDFVTPGSIKIGLSGKVEETAGGLMICSIAESGSSLNMRVATIANLSSRLNLRLDPPEKPFDAAFCEGTVTP